MQVWGGVCNVPEFETWLSRISEAGSPPPYSLSDPLSIKQILNYSGRAIISRHWCQRESLMVMLGGFGPIVQIILSMFVAAAVLEDQRENRFLEQTEDGGLALRWQLTLCVHSSQYIEGLKNTLYYCRRNNAATYGCRRLKPAASLRKIIPSYGFTVERLKGRRHGKRRVSSFQIEQERLMVKCTSCFHGREDSGSPGPPAALRFDPIWGCRLIAPSQFHLQPWRRSSCTNSAAICDQQPGLGTIHSHRGFGRRRVRQIILLFNKK